MQQGCVKIYRNLVAIACQFSHRLEVSSQSTSHLCTPTMPFANATTKLQSAAGIRNSVLAWPAWLRVLAVLPVLGLLWLGVAWALVDVVPL
jgi:hypothetical protein